MEIMNHEIRQKVNIREIYRYLGYGTTIPDENIKAMTEEVLDSLLSIVKPRNIYNIYTCDIFENEIRLRDCRNFEKTIVTKSRNLSANLKQCSKVILIAATLGIEADKLMQRYEILNMAKATITQACGAACIEAYCNILQERICSEVSTDEEKLYLRPRFSPGYGDLPLQCQRMIFEELQCTKRIGLTLTDSLLMYPTKSVTAFIGLTSNPQSCHIDKCKNCENTGCEFRNE